MCTAALTLTLILRRAWSTLTRQERYLKIIREGAAHSCLASDFQEHLSTLRPYRYAIPDLACVSGTPRVMLQRSDKKPCRERRIVLLLVSIVSSLISQCGQ